MEKFGRDLQSQLIALFSPESTQLIRTIGHGDFWNNNILFLNDQTTGKLIHQIFIDFQTTNITSPNLDLGYYLFTSVQPEIRLKHWKEILQTYFVNFKSTVELLTKKSLEITFESFLDDFKVNSLYGFRSGILFSTGIEVLGKINQNEIEGDFFTNFQKAFRSWIEINKDKVEEEAMGIIDICKLYENVMNSKLNE